MRTLPPLLQQAIDSGDFTGSQRAVTRVTIQTVQLGLYNESTKRQTYSSVAFPTIASGARELPNLRSLRWDRSIESQIGSCSFELFNTTPLPPGSSPAIDGSFDQLGYYSYERGKTPYSQTEWGHSENEWQSLLVPDRLIRVYQGYGVDYTVAPEDDPHMAQMGLYLIDDVTYTADGLITVDCRDAGRLLVDQIMFPPVVPFNIYPLKFDRIRTIQVPTTVPVTTTGSSSTWFRPTYQTSSNVPYVGVSGSVYGHHGVDAFDTSQTTYWLSIGNARPAQGYSFEYIQGKFSGRTVNSAKAHVWGGPYRVYLSVKVGSTWQGSAIIPYDPNNPASAPNGANIPYIGSKTVDYNDTVQFTFKAKTNVTAVRFTFTDLYNSGLGTYKYRAGVRDVQVLKVGSATTTTTKVVNVPKVVGNYSDYSQIVKLLLAYGGFYWPQNGKQYYTGSNVRTYTFSAHDPYLVKGRVWGDIQMSGVAGQEGVDLTPDIWDKKPLLDGINYIADILGFIFFIDEEGAAIFRAPNLFKPGNWLSHPDGSASVRTTGYTTLRDDKALLSMRAKLSSRNLREKIFISNTTGKVGAVANGRIPFPTNFRRVGGWCVDTETEIFTRRGWLKYDEVRAGDETLSIDAETGLAQWQSIREVAIFEPQEREMIEFSANNFTAVTTADHRWLVQRYNSRTKTWNWRVATSETLTTMDRIPRAVKRSDVPVEASIDDAIVELVAWAYTEGCIQRKGNWRGVTLYQSHTANAENCERIRAILEKAFPESWTERDRGTRGLAWRLDANSSREICRHLDENKAPTMDFLSRLTQEQLELFIQVSILGDGWSRRTSQYSKGPSDFFCQNVGPRLDSFLSACALAGIATSSHTRFARGCDNTPGGPVAASRYGSQEHASVTLLQNPWYVPAQTRSGRERRIQSQVVWCPSMPKHHNWLARRGGAVFYTMNTDQHFADSRECQVMADMITLRQLFTYRQNTIRIAANPGIQIDDQIKIIERTTGEAYFHHVTGLSSEWIADVGTWEYDLVTSWLGSSPSGEWAFKTTGLSAETLAYLETIGAF